MVTDRTPADLRVQPQQSDLHRRRSDALARFVEAVPAHILIAIDEAYVGTSGTACGPTA